MSFEHSSLPLDSADTLRQTVCFDVLLAETSRILPCRHAFHQACLEEILKMAPALCPMDRGPISHTSLIKYEPPPEVEAEIDQEHKMLVEAAATLKSSAKISKLVELLQLCEPDSKS